MRSASSRNPRRIVADLTFTFAAVLVLSAAAAAQSRTAPPSRPVARLVTAYGSSPAVAGAAPARAFAHTVVAPSLAAEGASADERRIFELINAARAKQNLAPLLFDSELCRVARRHSGEMAAGNYLDHTNVAGQDAAARAREEGVGWRALGENIARNQGFDDPAAFAVERWLQSAKHRANITNGIFTHTGLGVARAADGTFYFTQLFVMR